MSISVASLDVNFSTTAELSDPQYNIGCGGSSYDMKNLSSGNELLTNFDSSAMVVGDTANPAKYYLNLTPVRNRYMRSPNLSSFNTIGPDGSSSIVKKIPVNAPPG
jgi:hypothetical protein